MSGDALRKSAEQTKLKNARETSVGKKAHFKITVLPSDEHSSKPNRFLLVFCSCFLLIIASLALAIQIRPVSSAYQTFDVHPGESIQAAVDSASDHDIIKVYPGVYNEHITIPYTLSYLSLVGDPNDPTTTIINGTRTGTIFVLEQSGQNPYPSCHYINITGFTIRNAGDSYAAISAQRSNIMAGANDYHNISKNIIENSEIGISLGTSHYNIILDNTFLNNSISAIEIVDSDYNKISGNTIQESTYGVKLISNAINNFVISNTIITQTSYAIHISSGSKGTIISQNTLSGKTAGIYINSDNTIVDHNIATNGAYGIWLYTTSTNGYNGTITYNTFKNNSYGIKIQGLATYPAKNKVYNNKVIYNDWAIQTEFSNNNTFIGNWLQQNTYGAQLTSSNYNLLYRNNFIYNIVQASTNSLYNYWNKTGNGNHWSNWISPDVDNNGIVDNPYSIPPSQKPDSYPLVRTWSEHDISLETVTPSTYSAHADTIIDITVTVKNRANTSVSETFTVTAYNSTTPFETIRIDNEYIYRDVTTLGTVSVGDIRLTAVPPYTAGSPVSSGDTDIDQGLVPFALNEKHTVSGQYNLGKYIYRDVTTLGTVSVGDVRLTAVGSYLAGSIVVTGDTDIGQSLWAFDSNEKHRENVATNNIYEPGLNTNATKTLTFHWNTTGAAAGNYTITAKAGPVTDELNTDNNNKSPANQVKIKTHLTGDINYDDKVDFTDLNLLNQAYGSKLGDPIPPWNQSADLNKDNIIDIEDLALLGRNYSKTA